MNIVCIIQARTGSTRLPEKVLLKLCGKTVLEHVITRVKRSKRISKIVVATTESKDNNIIVGICQKMRIGVYRGSENDVLDRYYQAANMFKANHIVRITADCPLIDPGIMDDTIELHLQKKADFTSNALEVTLPDGLDTEVFTFKSLKKTWENANLTSEREHVTTYMEKNPKIFNIASFKYRENFSNKRWTLDEPRDYKFIRIIYKNLYKKNPVFGMDEVLGFLKSHPELEGITKGITRNEGLLKSLKHDKILNIK